VTKAIEISGHGRKKINMFANAMTGKQSKNSVRDRMYDILILGEFDGPSAKGTLFKSAIAKAGQRLACVAAKSTLPKAFFRTMHIVEIKLKHLFWAEGQCAISARITSTGHGPVRTKGPGHTTDDVLSLCFVLSFVAAKCYTQFNNDKKNFKLTYL